MSKLKISIDCSKTLLNVSFCSTFHLFTFSTSERLTFSSTYLFQKDERALPGHLHIRKCICFPLKCSVSHYSPLSFLSHLSVHPIKYQPQFKRLNLLKADSSWKRRLQAQRSLTLVVIMQNILHTKSVIVCTFFSNYVHILGLLNDTMPSEKFVNVPLLDITPRFTSNV
jgi:hypothetical protein